MYSRTAEFLSEKAIAIAISTAPIPPPITTISGEISSLTIFAFTSTHRSTKSPRGLIEWVFEFERRGPKSFDVTPISIDATSYLNEARSLIETMFSIEKILFTEAIINLAPANLHNFIKSMLISSLE